MQTFEVYFSISSDVTGCGGGAMRVSAANPADAVEAVKRAYPNARIIAVNAVTQKPINSAQDSAISRASADGFACDGMPYQPTSHSRSVAS